ncbi:MAG: hypothetical protein U0L79_09805 [Lachnospiraceae bacterium]|nr:hypothetical protein [Lachnospiraceae bacterium]
MKEVLSKNNYLMVKIMVFVSVVAVAIGLIFFLMSRKGKNESENSTSSYEQSTTIGVKTESIKETTEEGLSKEELNNSEIVSEEELTTSLVMDSSDSSTVESTTEPQTTTAKIITTESKTTQKQTTTAKPTKTVKPTTTKQTTTEEETTQPPRGANGVILETLTLQRLVAGVYTIPETWEEMRSDCNGDDNFGGFTVPYTVGENGVVSQNALGNEIYLYCSNDSSGSTEEDIIKIYGKPMYTFSRDGNKSILYKYHAKDYGVKNNIFIRFVLYGGDYNGKLGLISIERIVNHIESNLISP